MSNWLSIDEQSDVLVSLETCAILCIQLRKKPELWKPVIIGVHNGLQGAMVCHLTGTAQIGALDKGSAERILAWHNKDRKGQINRRVSGEDECGPILRPATPEDAFPAQKLADPDTLFKRLFSEHKRCESAGSVILQRELYLSSFQRLNTLRRDFAHFTPKGWSLEISGLPGICSNALSLIEIIYNCGWAFRHMDENHKDRLRDSLAALRLQFGCLATDPN